MRSWGDAIVRTVGVSDGTGSARFSLQGRPPQASPHWRSSWPALRRHGDQRGFDAGLSRPAHHHRPALRRKRKPGACTGSTAMWTGRELFRRALCRRRRVDVLDRDRRHAAPDLRRRNGLVLQGADGGPVRHAECSGRGPRARPAGERRRRNAGPSSMCWRIAIPRPRRGFARPIALRIQRALEIVRRDRPVARASFHGARQPGRLQRRRVCQALPRRRTETTCGSGSIIASSP